VVHFTWEVEVFGEKIGEQRITQTLIGAVGKYEIGEGHTRPHICAGLGMYMGGQVFDAEEGSGYFDSEADFKNAIGYNFGGGITADWGYDRFWLAEFVYHVVSREWDVAGAKSNGSNNWAIHLGVGMKL